MQITYLKNGLMLTHPDDISGGSYLGWVTESRKPMECRDETVWYQLIRYEYDLAGNLIKEKRFREYQTRTSDAGKVHTISYTYDQEDQLLQVSDCTGAVLQYGYDQKGRRTLEKRRINKSKETDTSLLLRRALKNIRL